MPKFAYAAIDSTGTTVEGVEKAQTLGDARAALLEHNLYPVRLEERKGLLDFELTQDEFDRIAALRAKNQRRADPPHAPVWDTP